MFARYLQKAIGFPCYSTCACVLAHNASVTAGSFVIHILQVCLLDLDYNLPVQVRDSATGKEVEDLPESDVNKEYVLNRLAEDGDLDSSYNKQRANDTILKLQRTTPYYKVSDWLHQPTASSLLSALLAGKAWKLHLINFYRKWNVTAEEQSPHLQFLCQGRV